MGLDLLKQYGHLINTQNANFNDDINTQGQNYTQPQPQQIQPQGQRQRADLSHLGTADLEKTSPKMFENFRTIKKDEIAKIQNDSGLIMNFFDNDERKNEKQQDLERRLKKHAQDNGYKDFLIDNDKIYYIKQDFNGEPIIHDFTPTFYNKSRAMKGEIAGGLGAGLVTIATGGTGLIPILGAGALGTTAGGAIDQKLRDEVTGDTDTIGGYLQRGAERGVDDLTFGVGLSALGKGAKTAYSVGKEPFKKATENLGELGGKVWDNSGVSAVLRHATTDNISGAETALNKAVQGEANALQGLVETRNALGESAYNKFVNETPLNIPKTKNETINKGIDFLNEKIVEPISQTTKKIISDSDLNQREANLFLSALGNKQNGAKIIKDSIANDPNAFEKAGKIFSKLNATARENLIKELGESKAVTDIFKEYEKSVKNDYAQVVDTLSEIFKEPVSTAKTQEIKRNILLSLQDSGYPLNSQYRTLVNETLQKPTDFKAWNELRNYTNAEIGKLTKNGVNDAISFDRVEALSAIKNKIDEAMEEIYEAEIKSPKFANASKELMEQARADYKVFKELETSELYRQISHGIKNENKMIETLLKANGNQNGVGLSEFLDILGVKSRAEMENAIIKSVIEKNTIDGVTNFKAINETLANLPIQTGRASSLKEYINTNSSILNNSSDILEFLNKSTPKTVELQQGIGSKVWGAIKVMFRNRVVNKLKSRLPIYGNNQALHNHIANAIKNSGDLETAIKNIEQMPTENLPSETAKALEAFKKDFANIKDEIRAEAKQDIKQTLKEMSDKGEIDILEMAKNIKPKQADQVAENLAQAEAKQAENVGKFGDEVDILQMAKDKNADLAKANEAVKGENFTMEANAPKAKTDYNVKMDLAPNTRDLSKITTDEISADLEYLAEKHPEMFSKPSEVFKLIKEIKNNPTFFYNNNRLDYALIVKRLQEPNKIGKLVVEKSSGEVKHATKVDDKDLARLERVSKKQQNKSSALSELSSDKVAKLENQGTGYQADDIIPQKTKQAEILLEKQKNINEITKAKFDENLQTALKNKEFTQALDEYLATNERFNFLENKGSYSRTMDENTEYREVTKKRNALYNKINDLFEIQARKNLPTAEPKTAHEPPKPKTQTELKAKFDELSDTYDIEAFLKDRENISANDIRYTRTAVNGSSSKTSRKNADGTYTYSKPEMEHNYKADFAFTKQDTARLRKQIQSGEFDENLLNKLKNDLDGAEPQGYTNYLKSADDIAESKAEKEFKQTGKEPEIKELKDGRIWDNKHGKYIYMFSNESLGGGLLGGSVSGIQTDENGNITGFDPAKFALGFGAGFGAMKLGANASIKDKANAVKQSVKQKQMQEKGKKFAEFCNRALKTDNKAVFDFGELSEKQVNSLRKIKNDLGQEREFDFSGYKLNIDSATIRHIKNNHPDDLKYLVNLGDIYENFTKATWDYKRNKKGQTEVIISLFKKYGDNEIRAVEIADMGNKILNLKTFHKMDKSW